MGTTINYMDRFVGAGKTG